MIDQTSPLESLDLKDPGDDTLRRFRYQITYAAILAVISIDERNGITDIYCEHHEDILVRHKNDTFTGVQVKTRDLDLQPFNFEDEAISSSLKKFVLLDNDYPGKFVAFSIVSNHGFDRTKTATCLKTLIQNTNDNVDVLVPRTKSKQLVTSLASECGCSTDDVLSTIKKLRLKTYCGLGDVHMKLINQIKSSHAMS